MNKSATRMGTVTIEGEHATLRFERRIGHPIHDVWDAITSPEHLARWAMSRVTIEPHVGGHIEFWNNAHATGRVLAWEPPRLFAYENNIEPGGQFPRGERSIIRWELNPDGDATLLRLTHANVNRGTAVTITPATHILLDRLEAQLNGAPLPDMMTLYGHVAALYPPDS